MQFKDAALESKVSLEKPLATVLNMFLLIQFVCKNFTELKYFFGSLLSLQCLFYLTQMIILPRTRLSTHVCFLVSIIVILVLFIISLTDNIKVSYCNNLFSNMLINTLI